MWKSKSDQSTHKKSQQRNKASKQKHYLLMLVRRDRKRARWRERERECKDKPQPQIIREKEEKEECERILSKRLEKLEVGRQICLHLLSTLATSLVAIINNCFHPSVGGNGKYHNLTFPF